MQGPIQNNTATPAMNQGVQPSAYTFEQFQAGVPAPNIQQIQPPIEEIKPPVSSAPLPVNNTPATPISEPVVATPVDEWKFIDMDVWDVIFWPIEKPGIETPQTQVVQ